MGPDEKECIWCAETIKAQARLCRFCNREQTPGAVQQQAPVSQQAAGGQEQMLLNEGDVWVTTQRAHFAGKIYAIANITSVQQGKEDASIWAWVIGIGGVLFGGVMATEKNGTGCAMGVAGVGFLFILVAWLSKADHWLKLSTSGVETQAFVSKDKDLVTRISAAIQQAMGMRGR